MNECAESIKQEFERKHPNTQHFPLTKAGIKALLAKDPHA